MSTAISLVSACHCHPSVRHLIIHQDIWIGQTCPEFLNDAGRLSAPLEGSISPIGRQARRQARRQDLAAGGGQKPGGTKKQKVGPHFKNTVLDVCSNWGAKREMGGTDFKWGTGHHWPPRWRRPCWSESYD